MRTFVLASTLLAASSGAARADDGYYILAGASVGAPTVTTRTGSTSDALTAKGIRSGLGVRTGRWAFEPRLSLDTIDRSDYAHNSQTTVREYGSYGAQVKWFDSRQPWGFYVRGGAHRSWTQATAMEGSLHGGGLDLGLGVQFGSRRGSAATGYALDFGYELTWLSPSQGERERIGTTSIAFVFGAGSGY